MRFCFLSTMEGVTWGGSEELWSLAALRLRSEGHDVSASVGWCPQLSSKVTNLAEHGIHIYLRHSQGARFFRRVWRRITWGQRKDYDWLQCQKPDLVVISHGGNGCNCEWMKFCREAGLPFAAIVQCNTELFWPTDDEGEEMGKAFRAAQNVFCVSQHNLALLERQVGQSLPNAQVVWNPYNVTTAIPPAWPAENGVWKLACVARLQPAAKGQDLLFQVLSRPQWKKRPVEINLYGAGPWEKNLKTLAASLQLSNVQFRGHVADIRAIWQENHLLVLPSRYEGLPLALVESMWCARPSVVTDIGGNAEVCLDGETGFVVAAPAMKLLEETMERAWNQRDDWQTMGKAARARAEQLVPKDPIGAFCLQLESRFPRATVAESGGREQGQIPGI